jgi:AMMECR1 domain-containing protein
MEKVSGPEELEMGVHGAMLEAPLGRGLFLPQVATEQGWDRDTFMDHLCRKAGLPMEYWKDGIYSLYRFSAFVFP